MKHLTILNPNAGGYTPKEQDKITKGLSGLEGKVITTPDVHFLDYELQCHQNYRPDLLGIGGGDGTVSRTLTLMKERWRTFPDYIAVYAFGTMNNVAVPLGACDGLYDKIKRYVGFDTKAVQVAHYIGENAHNLRSETLTPMDINGRLGFNVGFGQVARMVWMYYGKTMQEFHACNQQQGQTKSGMKQVAKLLMEAGRALCNSHSAASEFFNQPIDATIYVDGKKMDLATGIYVASYEQQNTGIFRAIPSPGARKIAGKMEVVISHGSIQDVITSLPAIMRGKPARNIEYIHAYELRLESNRTMIGQVDGEFVFGKEFVVRPDMPMKFVSLPSKRDRLCPKSRLAPRLRAVQ